MTPISTASAVDSSADPDRDDQHLPGAVDQLGEDVLAERGGAEQVRAGRPEAAGVDGRRRAVVRDHPGEQRDQA